MFTDPAERAKAMGIFGFVAAGGGTIGVILGGIITELLTWNWIFLINLPIGTAVYLFSTRLLPGGQQGVGKGERKLDLAGAITVTSSLVIATYAIVNAEHVGWLVAQTVGLLVAAVCLFAVFLVIEARTAAPLMPLGLFRIRNIAIANAIQMFYAVGLFASFFVVALYLQHVLGYDPLKIGLAYLPFTLPWCILSLAYSGKLVMRFGIKRPAFFGLICFAAGILLLARVPVNGDFLVDILPAMLLQGIGVGIAANPLLLSATTDAPQEQAGLASGVVNTSFLMGGALGLAILSTAAAAVTKDLKSSGESLAQALTGGYQLAFLLGGIFMLASAILCLAFTRFSMGPGEQVEATEEAAQESKPLEDRELEVTTSS
jgi:MFS family permease